MHFFPKQQPYELVSLGQVKNHNIDSVFIVGNKKRRKEMPPYSCFSERIAEHIFEDTLLDPFAVHKHDDCVFTLLCEMCLPQHISTLPVGCKKYIHPSSFFLRMCFIFEIDIYLYAMGSYCIYCSIILPLQSMSFPCKDRETEAECPSSDCQGAEWGTDPLFLSRTLNFEDHVDHAPWGPWSSF